MHIKLSELQLQNKQTSKQPRREIIPFNLFVLGYLLNTGIWQSHLTKNIVRDFALASSDNTWPQQEPGSEQQRSCWEPLHVSMWGCMCSW